MIGRSGRIYACSVFIVECDCISVEIPYSDQCEVTLYRGVKLISVIPFNCFPVEELVAGLFRNLCVRYTGAFNDSLFVERFGVTFIQEEGDGIEENIVRILEYIGENPLRTGLDGTPDRIRRMLGEICRGYDPAQKPKITVFPNGEDGLTYDNMVIDEGTYYSLCEHHMMPFFGKYWFAYIPNPKGKILGISKIGRVVDYCAAKLQVQERLTHEIVDMLAEALGRELGRELFCLGGLFGLLKLCDALFH